MFTKILNNFKKSRARIVWYFLKPYPHYIIGITILSFLSSFFDGMNVLILFSILNSAISVNTGSNLGGGIAHSVDLMIRLFPLKDTFISACILLILSICFKNLFSYVQKVVSAYAGFRIWDDVQKKIFSKCIFADYQYFLDHKQGEIIYRVYNAPASLGGLLNLLPQALAEGFKLLAVGFVLVGISPYASISIIIVGVLFYYLTKYIASNISYNLGQGRTIATEKQNVILSETISGIRQIKVFSAENRWRNAFFAAMQDYFKLARKDKEISPLPGHLLETLTIVILALFLIVAKIMNPINFSQLLPILGTFAYAFQKLMPSLSLLGNLRIEIMGALPIIEVVYSSLNDMTKKIPNGERKITDFKNKIVFENVTFSYPSREGVLKNIDITFEKGTTTAIVGHSGAGKSTIADIIVRLFMPDSGKILIDDVDLKDCDISTWLSRIGFVTQDTFIFNASLAENIAFGLNIEMQDIIQSAKNANAHDFIMDLPEQYNTIVGDRGMKLSGGQRQRIAIARALVRKPEILVLDEATSSLDNISETIVQEAINRISVDRTVIIIAHRLSTIINADKIIVLDKGLVAEEGKHADLLLKRGFYWRLYNNEKAAKEVEK